MEEFQKTLDECLKILDENIDILSNLEYDLEDKKEDECITELNIYQLYDFVEDVSFTSKIKHAETNLLHRQSEDLP